MKVSFIIPVYNVEAYIAECIESILHQTVSDFEIILVDDGSPDQSGEICDRYADMYPCIQVIHQENQGVSAARNHGIEKSRGEWLCFVDGDDTISPYLMEHCLPYLKKDQDICFFQHNEVKETAPDFSEAEKNPETPVLRLREDDFREFELAIFNRDYPGRYDYHKLKMATPCKFYRKEPVICHNITFPEGVPTGEDALFNLNFYQHAKSGIYVEQELYDHRVWENSVSQGYDRNAEQKFDLLHEHLKAWIKASPDPERFRSVYDERCIWSVGFCCILNFCSPKNPASYSERKQAFKKMRNKYIHEIKAVNLHNFRLEKKILFLCIRLNWFFMVNSLCFLKNKR